MDGENYKFYGGISFLYGLFFLYCMEEGFSTITFPVCVVGTIFVYLIFLKKAGIKIRRGSRKYLVGMTLLGISNCLTTNWIFIFLNVVAILLLFMVFMLQQFYDDHTWQLFPYLKNIGIAVAYFFQKLFSPFIDGISVAKNRKNEECKNKTTGKQIFAGLLITIGILFLVIPLLMSSDMMFAKIWKRTFSIFWNFHWNFGAVAEKGILFVIGVMCCYGFFKGLSSMKLKEKSGENRKVAAMVGITIHFILAGLYAFYSLIQVIYLFGGRGLPEGITYAEYARTGFFELVFVSCINFLLVAVSNTVFEENKRLKILLFVISGCTFIMIGSSGYRMFLYIQQYHFTLLRVIVLWFLVVLACFMAGLLIFIEKKEFPLFRYMVVVLMVLYIPFVYSRPEAWIARYNFSQEEVTWDDVNYFLYEGGYDCIPVITQCDTGRVKDQDIERQYWYSDEAYEIQSVEDEIAYHMEQLLKTDSVTLKNWNYSRAQAHQAAKRYLEEYK